MDFYKTVQKLWTPSVLKEPNWLTKHAFIWSKYSKNSTIVKYFYNLKYLFSM